MIQPLSEIVNKFSKRSDFTFDNIENEKLLSILKGNLLLVKVIVYPEYPEWQVYVYNRNNNEILVSELFDYVPVTTLNQDEAKLELQKAANDLNSFLERVSAKDVRVKEWNTFFTKHSVFESLDIEEWIFEFNNALAKWNNPDRGQKRIYS